MSRELVRNRYQSGRYDPRYAHHKAYVRRKYARYEGKKIEGNPDLERYIVRLLRKGLSPEAVSGRMWLEHQPFSASKDLIYRWLSSVWGERYQRLLAHRRYRKRRNKKRASAVHIPKRINIADRPAMTPFDYEGDTIVCSQSTSAIVTFHNPKTLYTDARWVSDLKPARVARAFRSMMCRVSIRSLTLDNGLENRAHLTLGIPTYFCAPYHSWEKAGVENANKLIRRFVPKGTDLATVSVRRLRDIVRHVNHLPRRKLGWYTPLETMQHRHLLNKKTKNTSDRGGALRG